jgi:hypothetical protein
MDTKLKRELEAELRAATTRYESALKWERQRTARLLRLLDEVFAAAEKREAIPDAVIEQVVGELAPEVD